MGTLGQTRPQVTREEGDPQRSDGGATGVALWEASFVLAEWLSRQRKRVPATVGQAKKWDKWRGKCGVELGAGLGLPSIVAARLGVKMVATDGDAAALRLLQRNAASNGPRASPIQVERLLWGVENPVSLLRLEHPPDLLLASDVVYASAKEELSNKLIATMLSLAGPQTLVILSNVRRFPEGHPRGEGRFFARLARFFDRSELPRSCLHEDYRRGGVGSCVIHLLHRRTTVSDVLDDPCLQPGGDKPQRRKTIQRKRKTSVIPFLTDVRKRRTKKRKGSVNAKGVMEVETKSQPRKRQRKRARAPTDHGGSSDGSLSNSVQVTARIGSSASAGSENGRLRRRSSKGICQS